MVKIRLLSRRCGFHLWVGKIPLEKEMATHFSILAWEMPWIEEPGALQSMGSQRIRLDLATKQQHKGGGSLQKREDSGRVLGPAGRGCWKSGMGAGFLEAGSDAKGKS